MTQTLEKDATLITVWDSLTYPREYVAGARHQMEKCYKEHGNAAVRIGVTGSGQKPCYRVTYQAGDSEEIYGSFWDMHDPLDNEKAINSNWSTASLEFDEVDQFLKEKIGWKPSVEKR